MLLNLGLITVCLICYYASMQLLCLELKQKDPSRLKAYAILVRQPTKFRRWRFSFILNFWDFDLGYSNSGVCNFFHFILFQASESSDSTSTDCSKEMKHPLELVSAETRKVEVTPSEATEEKSGHLVIYFFFFLVQNALLFLFLLSFSQFSFFQLSADKDTTSEEHIGDSRCTQDNGRFVANGLSIKTDYCNYKIEELHK